MRSVKCVNCNGKAGDSILHGRETRRLGLEVERHGPGGAACEQPRVRHASAGCASSPGSCREWCRR